MADLRYSSISSPSPKSSFEPAVGAFFGLPSANPRGNSADNGQAENPAASSSPIIAQTPDGLQ